MTAKEFVKNINETQISINYLRENYSEGFANRILKESVIPKLSSQYVEHGNEILNLVLNYDLELFRVVEIHFDKDLFKDNNSIFFGWDGIGDRLGFDMHTKEVFTYYVYGDSITFYCAPNDSIFLDLLFELHKFHNNRIYDIDNQEAKSLKKTFMIYVSAYFGNNKKYVDFYAATIGYDDDL
ncbi:hypothetical protein [Sphingobacterium spiritivorum]|nr:hypothetical protein [Sphingobacterium spiritivorum]QQS96033.1 hypothetical protein I6J03_22135 [Sphingobacterium spiritivorum]